MFKITGLISEVLPVMITNGAEVSFENISFMVVKADGRPHYEAARLFA